MDHGPENNLFSGFRALSGPKIILWGCLSSPSCWTLARARPRARSSSSSDALLMSSCELEEESVSSASSTWHEDEKAIAVETYT